MPEVTAITSIYSNSGYKLAKQLTCEYHNVVYVDRIRTPTVTLLSNFSLKQDYIDAIEGIMKSLVKVTPNRKLTFIGELKAKSRAFSPKMVTHLVHHIHRFFHLKS